MAGNLDTDDALAMAAKSRDMNRRARLAAEASLKVAVRALEEIRDKRLNKYGDCEGCCRSKQELFIGGHDAYFVCGIASRALAALRAAKVTP